MNKELESGIDRLKLAKVCCEEMQLDPSCKLQVGFYEAEIDVLLSALQQPKETTDEVNQKLFKSIKKLCNKCYFEKFSPTIDLLCEAFFTDLKDDYIILKRQQE